MLAVDHLVWGVPDLALGVADMEDRCGATVLPGGAHPGAGTRNGILPLDGGIYVEVLAPDRDQNLDETIGEVLAGLEHPALMGWAARTSDMWALKQEGHLKGYDLEEAVMTRRRPDGVLLEWRLGRLEGRSLGGVWPFFIDWMDSPHPTDGQLAGCSLRHLIITSPEADELNRFLRSVGLGVVANDGPVAGLEAVLDTPSGQVRLRGRHMD